MLILRVSGGAINRRNRGTVNETEWNRGMVNGGELIKQFHGRRNVATTFIQLILRLVVAIYAQFICKQTYSYFRALIIWAR